MKLWVKCPEGKYHRMPPDLVAYSDLMKRFNDGEVGFIFYKATGDGCANPYWQLWNKNRPLLVIDEEWPSPIGAWRGRAILDWSALKRFSS